MVNPELDYVKVKVHMDHDKTEDWIVASALAGVFIGGVANKKFEILEEFKGEKLLGTKYEHPFHDYMPYTDLKKHHKNVHTVILSEEFVDTSAGTGLVHCAPGCGPEDYEVGKKYGIPPFNNIDELITKVNQLDEKYYNDRLDIINANYNQALAFVDYEQNIIDTITSVFHHNQLI
jgi:isoleucyl-tRNA synthetase